MKRRYWLSGVSFLALAACGLGSTSPIIPPDSWQFEPKLLGAWVGEASKESVVITGSPSQGYSITYTDDDGKIGRFEGHLGRLGKYHVLDLRPLDPQPDASPPYNSLLLHLHAPVIIDSIGSFVQFRMIEPDSLKGYLEREPAAIAHMDIEDVVVLTASTSDLQRFLLTFLGRPGVLGDSGILRRRSP